MLATSATVAASTTRRPEATWCKQAGSRVYRWPAIARTCGINANVLSNWVRQHERGRCGAAAARGDIIEMPAASAFVAVQVDSAPPVPAPVAPALDLQVRLANGTTLELRGADLDDVLKLVEGLGRLRCSASMKP